MSDLINRTGLDRKGLSPAYLLQKFREQLLKDFEMSNIAILFPPQADFSYEDVHQALGNVLKKLIDSGNSSLTQLLYRIDISEKQINAGLQGQEGRHPHDILAELIIKRILQKVILKATHSK